MLSLLKKAACTFVLLIFILEPLKAQEENAVAVYGKRYVSINVKSLDRYTRRIERQQRKLLTTLRRKERRLARQLLNSDSLAYSRFQSQGLTFDSIGRIVQGDSARLQRPGAKRNNKTIDSLKAVASFVAVKGGTVRGVSPELAELEKKIEHQEYILSLIDQRSLNLKNISNSASVSVPVLKCIEKDIYYAKSRMNVFKEISQEPTKAEEMALEYLQGVSGFDGAFNRGNTANAMATAGDADALEKMGFQTKKQVNAHLQKQLGSRLGDVQQQMSDQINDFQPAGKLEAVSTQVKQVKELETETKAGVAQGRETINGIKRPAKEQWKISEVKGLPLRKRIEKGITWQTSRPSQDGRRPALLEAGASIAYRQTDRLTYGLGAGTSIGLGKSWSDIRLSFEGLIIRSFATWKLIYGISAYAGYERYFLQSTAYLSDVSTSPRSESNRQQSALLGLTKSYSTGSNKNGTIQVLYDIWWKERGLNNPLIIRFATTFK